MSIKTSATHPLQIDTLEIGPGRLGLTFCPGKKQPDAQSGHWDRDLQADLTSIQEWGAKAVVSVIEEQELGELGVPELGDAVEELGIDWHHVSVPDVDIPGPGAEARWFYTSTRIRRMLAAGEAVLIHCKGGLGRTGTLGARLLVETGSEPGEAIEQVRAARPHTIETPEQETYVRGLRPWAGRPESVPAPTQAVHDGDQDDGAPLVCLPGPTPTADERILGCLLGGAVGDAFGYAVEFDRWPEIKKKYGVKGLQEPVLEGEKLIVSDDTQMTMFTAEGLLRAVASSEGRGMVSAPAVVWFAYQRWLGTQFMPARTSGDDGWLVGEKVLNHLRAPGNTCLRALQRELPEDSRPAPNDSKGCGGVMRVAPVGVVHQLLGDRERFDMACELAWLTHGHPSGYLSAGAMAAIIGSLMEGQEIESAAENALELLRGRKGAEETIGRLDQALSLARESKDANSRKRSQAVSALGEGWVGEEALGIALYAALAATSFPDVIRLAANHDGDSDSTASIAAQIYGARHGLSDLPNGWVNRLDVLEPLLFLAHDLPVVADGTRPWLRHYPPN
jgi:ADP-ribosylglycohydrolase/protein-tyrosine phosphatase